MQFSLAKGDSLVQGRLARMWVTSIVPIAARVPEAADTSNKCR
jgi:hypothetical protein